MSSQTSIIIIILKIISVILGFENMKHCKSADIFDPTFVRNLSGADTF